MNDLIPFAMDSPQKSQGLSKGNKILARAPLFSADFFCKWIVALSQINADMQQRNSQTDRGPCSACWSPPLPACYHFKNYLREKPALCDMEKFITDAKAKLLAFIASSAASVALRASSLRRQSTSLSWFFFCFGWFHKMSNETSLLG